MKLEDKIIEIKGQICALVLFMCYNQNRRVLTECHRYVCGNKSGEKMINLADYRTEIGEITFALSLLHYRGLEIRPTVRASLDFLTGQYEASGNRAYLEMGLFLIQAFLNTGYPYEAEGELFDRFLTSLGTEREQIRREAFLSQPLIKVNKYQVRRMIERWMPSKENPMKISEVVEDIIEKVKKRKTGRYYYKYEAASGRRKTPPKEQGAYRYELVVTEKECFFYDVRKQKFYRFY